MPWSGPNIGRSSGRVCYGFVTGKGKCKGIRKLHARLCHCLTMVITRGVQISCIVRPCRDFISTIRRTDR